MGGKGSGRPRTRLYGDYSLEQKGRYEMLSSKRFKTFSYNQNGDKFYGIKDKFTGTIYKRIQPDTFTYVQKRFAVEDPDKILSRLDIYTKEGLYDRAETARGNVVSALNSYFDTNASFTINETEYSLSEILEKIKNLQGDERWMDFSLRNSKLIDSFFVGYRALMGESPRENAGMDDFGNKDYMENINNEQDETASVNYDRMMDFIEDLVTTFKF